MALIKGTQVDRFVRQGMVLELGDLGRQAEQALRAARAEAQRIVEESRVEAQQLCESASQRGHAEGLQQGLDEGRVEGRSQGREQAIEEFQPQIETLVSRWTEAVQRWELDRNAMLLDAREDVLKFALAMGTKITHRTLQADPTIVADQLTEVLAQLTGSSAVTVSIHSEDREVVELLLGELDEKFKQCAHVNLRDDPAVTRGGCIVTTDRGRIDATIEGQIERIVDTLLPPTSEAPPPPGAGAP